MKTTESYTIWLETAYKLFAEKGPDNFSVKEVAQLCGLPRTNFYYYFENKKELIDKIIELHFQSTTEIFNIELNKRLNCFLPDLYEVIYDFKLGIQFAKQLFLHRENPKYNQAYKNSVALSADIIVPKFMQYYHIHIPEVAVKSLWFTLTDTWYSRLNFNIFSVDSLCSLCLEIMDTVLPLIEQQSPINSQTKHSFDTPV